MPIIHLETFIKAPKQRVFDLSRSIDLHAASMQHTSEKAVAGITSGLINKGETVTWQAKHLFQTRKLQVEITQMNLYDFFEDKMIKGDFKKMKHQHFFKEKNNGTIMIDDFYFEAPFGIIGKFANYFFLKKYMKQFLQKRNAVIKEFAESEKWKEVLEK